MRRTALSRRSTKMNSLYMRVAVESHPCRKGCDKDGGCGDIRRLIFGEHGYYAVHRSTKIAVLILDTAIRPRCFRLVVRVQHGVETAVEGKYSGVIEFQV